MNKRDPAVGIPNSIDIQCLSRFDQNAGDSNPLNILGAMAEYRELIRTGTYSVSLFVYTLIQDVYTGFCNELPKPRRKGCGMALHNLQSSLISGLYASQYVDGDNVIDTEWDEATEYCRDLIERSDFKGCGRYISVPKNRKVDTYDEDTDVFCLIADRDRGSNTTERYLELVRACGSQHIRLFVSNPCFEFWLLLHSDKVIKLGETECGLILANAKQDVRGVRRSYCECKLIEYFGHYSKTDVNFEQDYMRRLNQAIEHAESFETDLFKLESNLGTNVGLLISELKSQYGRGPKG